MRSKLLPPSLCLAALLAVFCGANPAQAQTRIRVCNEGQVNVKAARVSQSPVHATYRADGWYLIPAGKCTNIDNNGNAVPHYFAFAAEDTANRFGTMLYTPAEGRAFRTSDRWFCVRPKGTFDIFGSLDHLAYCTGDMVLARFTVFTDPINNSEYTLTIAPAPSDRIVPFAATKAAGPPPPAVSSADRSRLNFLLGTVKCQNGEDWVMVRRPGRVSADGRISFGNSAFLGRKISDAEGPYASEVRNYETSFLIKDIAEIEPQITGTCYALMLRCRADAGRCIQNSGWHLVDGVAGRVAPQPGARTWLNFSNAATQLAAWHALSGRLREARGLEARQPRP